MTSLEQCEVDIGVDAIGLQERLLHSEEREVATRVRAAPRRKISLSELDDVLRERKPVDRETQSRDRGGEAPLGRFVLGQLRLGGNVAGKNRQRGTRRVRGLLGVARGELQPRKQRFDVSHVLGNPAAGADRTVHVVDRGRQVAVKLGQVRRARVRGQRGLFVEHLLERPRGRRIPAKLHVAVDYRAERSDDRRREPVRAERQLKSKAELVAR